MIGPAAHLRARAPADNAAGRSGFTLMELLLVVTIIAICAGISIPYFVEAHRAAGLRTSARTIAMTAKYARAMAILKQQDMALLFDAGAGKVELVSLGQPASASDQEKFLDQRASRSSDFAAAEASRENPSDEPAAAALPTIKPELENALAEGVKIDKMGIGKDDRVGNIAWVFFNRNGTCSGFTVRLEDARGNGSTIEMDGISGFVKVTADERGRE